ncbi:hypothetical protein EVAR_97753_1 [Eumeta japonica]|uniref:Uncharacterized protein n=1 Tax=Eumeta variegata TaxID=151549 RepID=A0A4C1X655_EUMVA|nr:hypothetical protein EVAR_97753_1 [Eumeta japonica]
MKINTHLISARICRVTAADRNNGAPHAILPVHQIVLLDGSILRRIGGIAPTCAVIGDEMNLGRARLSVLPRIIAILLVMLTRNRASSVK